MELFSGKGSQTSENYCVAHRWVPTDYLRTNGLTHNLDNIHSLHAEGGGNYLYVFYIMCVSIYLYIYTYRERKRERQRSTSKAMS